MTLVICIHSRRTYSKLHQVGKTLLRRNKPSVQSQASMKERPCALSAVGVGHLQLGSSDNVETTNLKSRNIDETSGTIADEKPQGCSGTVLGSNQSGDQDGRYVEGGMEEWQIHSRQAKTFRQMPGPIGVPYFGMLFHYREKGSHPPTDFHNSLLELHARYGKIFRKTINGETTVHLFDPDYIEQVHRSVGVGNYPYIVPLLRTTQMYRQYRGMSPGLGNVNGEEWYHLRTAVQRIMLVPKTVPAFLPVINQVADAFIQRLHKIKDPQTGCVDHFNNEVAKWNLESSAMTCFEKRLGCLDAGPNSFQQRLIDANNKIFDLSLNLTFSVPWYRLFATPTWKKLLATEDFFFGYGQSLVDSTCEQIRSLVESDELEEGQYTFLRYLMARKDLSYKELSVIALSLFADGLSTTTPTLISQLYCLATNPDKQAKLYEEIKNISPDKNEPITDEMIQRASYLRGCIKEGFRFFPIGTDISRVPQKDMVIGGYQIPAGTAISLNSNLMLRSPEYFQDPEKYIPERWVRGGSAKSIHPYLLLPFGHGTRICAGMRLAEQEMRVVIIKLLQRYRLEWPVNMKSMGQKYVMLQRPDCDAKIAFISRD